MRKLLLCEPMKRPSYKQVKRRAMQARQGIRKTFPSCLAESQTIYRQSVVEKSIHYFPSSVTISGDTFLTAMEFAVFVPKAIYAHRTTRRCAQNCRATKLPFMQFCLAYVENNYQLFSSNSPVNGRGKERNRYAPRVHFAHLVGMTLLYFFPHQSATAASFSQEKPRVPQGKPFTT